MTLRDFYTEIQSITEVRGELKEMAAAQLQKMDTAAENRRKVESSKKAEKEIERTKIRTILVDTLHTAANAMTASELIAAAGLEITPQSIPNLMKPLIEDGTVIRTSIKVSGKGTHVGYELGTLAAE